MEVMKPVVIAILSFKSMEKRCSNRLLPFSVRYNSNAIRKFVDFSSQNVVWTRNLLIAFMDVFLAN